MLSHHSSLSSALRDQRPITPPGSRSHLANGQPSDQLQNLSLSVLDAFGSVHDILNKVDKKHSEIVEMIESLPARKASDPSTTVSCHDRDLLQLKSTSGATLRGLESTLAILKELRGHELGPPIVVHQTIPLPHAFSQSSSLLLGSPAHRSVSSVSSMPSTPIKTSRSKLDDLK